MSLQVLPGLWNELLIGRENKLFMGLSFETISSTGANAGESDQTCRQVADSPAIIHYAPPKLGSSIIDRDKMYLCDSGGKSDMLSRSDMCVHDLSSSPIFRRNN